MKRIFLRYLIALPVILLSCYSLGQADTSVSDMIVPRTDQNSLIARQDLLNKARQGIIDIYFQGDSILRRWGTSDIQYADLLANWQENFHGWNAADFAWGGDTVQNILWRLYEGEMNGLNPKVIVLMAGTNNLGGNIDLSRSDEKVAEVSLGIRLILDFMQLKAPDAIIILTGVLPRNGSGGNTDLIPVINAINEEIATYADGQKIRYININHKLADENGKLYEGMTVDGLHLSARGYQHWADELVPIFTELLGPPADVDFAPPPTGDPSAR